MGGRKMERFNVLLTNKRIEKKLNKAQVANKMGLTPMYYARFENGDLCPTKRNVKQFAEFLFLPYQHNFWGILEAVRLHIQLAGIFFYCEHREHHPVEHEG